MMRLYLMVIVAAAVLAAVIGDAGHGTQVPPTKAGQEQVLRVEAAERSPQEQATFYAAHDAVDLRREANGHFYADVAVNNMSVRFMIDTGATGIALSRDDARRAGLAVSAGMFEVVAEGANGDVRGEWVTLDSVRLGHEEARQVPAVILDGGQQSLLGQSFLRQFSSVEIKGDRMILR